MSRMEVGSRNIHGRGVALSLTIRRIKKTPSRGNPLKVSNEKWAQKTLVFKAFLKHIDYGRP